MKKIGSRLVPTYFSVSFCRRSKMKNANWRHLRADPYHKRWLFWPRYFLKKTSCLFSLKLLVQKIVIHILILSHIYFLKDFRRKLRMLTFLDEMKSCPIRLILNVYFRRSVCCPGNFLKNLDQTDNLLLHTKKWGSSSIHENLS